MQFGETKLKCRERFVQSERIYILLLDFKEKKGDFSRKYSSGLVQIRVHHSLLVKTDKKRQQRSVFLVRNYICTGELVICIDIITANFVIRIDIIAFQAWRIELA